MEKKGGFRIRRIRRRRRGEGKELWEEEKLVRE